MNPFSLSMKRSLIVGIALLLLLLPLVQSPVVASGENLALASFQTLWPTISNNTDGSSIAVDANGGVHLAFAAYTAVMGAYPAYYGYCAANCGTETNWTVKPVRNIGVYGGNVRLEVNAAGQPRMVWFRQSAGMDDGAYQYAQCDSDCTNAAKWSVATLYPETVGASNTRYFALNHQGNPRFLYTDTASDHEGTFYAYCDANCASAGNWDETQISDEYLLYDFSLAFTATGAARLAYRHAGGEDTVEYAECAANCQNAASWNSVILVDVLGAYGALSMDLNPQGKPRLAYYSGYLDASSPDNDLLYYGWCDSNCLQDTSWTFAPVGLPEDYGKQVELAVDAQNRLHLAYAVEDMVNSVYGLGYTVCKANCTTTSPTWEDSLVETDSSLDANYPIPVKAGCSASYWLDVGKEPSLAVDALGQPRVGFNAVHYQGGTCTSHEDGRLVRYGQSGSSKPIVDLKEKVYLPLTRR